MTVRDLISSGRMDGNTLEYVKETGFTNSAAPVAEGAANLRQAIGQAPIEVDVRAATPHALAQLVA